MKLLRWLWFDGWATVPGTRVQVDVTGILFLAIVITTVVTLFG